MICSIICSHKFHNTRQMPASTRYYQVQHLLRLTAAGLKLPYREQKLVCDNRAFLRVSQL